MLAAYAEHPATMNGRAMTEGGIGRCNRVTHQ